MGTADRAGIHSGSPSIASTRILSVLAILAVAVGVGIFDHDIWSPTEPTVAGVVAGMVRNGDLAVPRIHGFAYLEKPPLYYWSAWLAARLAGRFDAGILRLPSALFGLASLALVGRTSRRFHGERIAWACALLGATSLSLCEVFHRACTDSAAVFFAFLAFTIFAETLAPGVEGDSKRVRRLDVLLAFALAASFYAKNFYTALIAIPPIGVFLVWKREARRLLRIAIWLGAALILLVGPWCVILYRSGGWEYLRSVFLDNTFGRFFDLGELGRSARMPISDAYTAEKGHSPLVYLWALLYLPLPWTPLVAAALAGVFSRLRRSPLNGFLAVAVVVMPVALALSASRVAIYLVPMLWPCLVAVGGALHELEEGRGTARWIAANAGLCGVLMLAAPVAAAAVLGDPRIAWEVLPAAVVVLAIAVLWKRRTSAAGFLSSACASIAAGYCALFLALLPSVNAEKSYRPLFDEIHGVLDGRKLYTAIRDDRYLPLADYYVGRGLELVDDESALVDRLRSPERVGLFLTANRLREEDSRFAGIPHMALCASRGKQDLVLVINH